MISLRKVRFYNKIIAKLTDLWIINPLKETGAANDLLLHSCVEWYELHKDNNYIYDS